MAMFCLTFIVGVIFGVYAMGVVTELVDNKIK